MSLKYITTLLIIAFASATSLHAQTEVRINVPDGEATDHFGWAVSISGDYALIGTQGRGAYMFKREGSTWVEQVDLAAFHGIERNFFGSSVSIEGDYALVGARSGTGVNGENTGVAYVFKREGESWGIEAILSAADSERADGFGGAVSLSGDYALIGAKWDDDYERDLGSAYVFKREMDQWIEQVKLTAPDSGYAEFGGAVSINGDYALIGGMTRTGRFLPAIAYMFKREGDTWIEHAKLSPSSVLDDNSFGESVSLSGDYALLGVPSSGGASRGSAYVYKREDDAWIEQKKLVGSDLWEYEYFGSGVSLNGDYALVGAPGSNFRLKSGSVFVFEREGDAWLERTRLIPSDSTGRISFGRAVSLDGDRVLVGAIQDKESDRPSGSSYVLELDLDGDKGFSDDHALEQNYPNPFQQMTTISYFVQRTGHVRLEVFDMLGRKVETLVNGTQFPGRYEAKLGASALSTGMYIYRLSIDNYAESKKLTVLK